MHCNSCSNLIEKSLKTKVNKVSADYSKEILNVDYDENKISESEIKNIVEKLGYSIDSVIQSNKKDNFSDNLGWIVLGIALFVLIIFLFYLFFSVFKLPEINLPNIGEKTSLILLFAAGLLVGFHCVSMCGAFVLSYTTKNAQNGYKGYFQHIIYGGSKVISYALIGGIFGIIGGIFAFSVGLRGTIAILAGLFMIFYALSMFGIKFFRKFQFNPKFLTKFTNKANSKAKGPYIGPFITGLLNGLFIACGPLQAMYLYAAGTGSFVTGALSLAAFGLGTLPVMLIFGSIATVISQKTASKILKFSAIIVLILGLIMINRGLNVLGSPYSFEAIKDKLTGTSTIDPGTSSAIIDNNVQTINMNVDGNGYSPSSFVLKKGVKVKWNINVLQLTSCDSELIAKDYNIDINLKQGQNSVEFTPDKDGTIPFTCGMGMLHGNFIVTDTGTASTQELNSAKPSTSSGSGSCNMGSGGSCGCK